MRKNQNPFDIEQDKKDYYYKEIEKLYGSEEPRTDEYCDAREIYKTTKKAIKYLRKTDSRLIESAISKASLEEMIEKAHSYVSEQGEIISRIDKLFEEIKKESGISPPQTIEDIIAIVEKIMPKRITRKNYEEWSNFLIRGSYAHYLRTIAREAWDLKNK